ncbi:MAG: type II toxin-antitoxin system VapC family toxin [Candidatus Margulisbacteria bacterium]|jgi:predicted nucleic acid-binding protein|nr:type II toxin-antitoxin system VapC family toxin [Candidatus Margulisiibacteriota bacterium]
MIFLDTNTVSYLFDGDTKIKRKLTEAIGSGAQICLTAINVYEVLKGLKYRKNKRIEAEFENFLCTTTVIPFDEDAVVFAADIYADLRKRGITIGDADILIAAIVISNNGTLVSRNLKHYQYIKNLNLLDW